MVTTCAAQRGTSWLVSDSNPSVLIEAMRWQRDQGGLRLLGYCIMPDHLHWIFCLTGDTTLSQVMKSFSSYTARRLDCAPPNRGRIWQEGFYDHVIRGMREYEARLTYIHNNPVRAGLVGRAEDWPYSTAHPSLMSDIDRQWLV